MTTPECESGDSTPPASTCDHARTATMTLPPPMSRIHSFAPIVSPSARVLVLGSMPGVRSLQADQYYAHPRNHFWPFMHAMVGIDPALAYRQRCLALGEAGIALWDVLGSCERIGSLDSAIRDASALPNDLAGLLAQHPAIRTVLFNGAKAEQSYRRFVAPGLGDDGPACLRLPSTSPANASQRVDDKREQWRQGLLAAGVEVLP